MWQDLMRLGGLMARTQGSRAVQIGLIDGPVAANHPDLADSTLVPVDADALRCRDPGSTACMHGTFVSGILAARRGGLAPGLCPRSPLLVRPIFPERPVAPAASVSAGPPELAFAIGQCVARGARIINISADVLEPTVHGAQTIRNALDEAARHQVIVVAAAGNTGTVSGNPITQHPWVIPVVACDAGAVPLVESNLSRSIGERGFCAFGEDVRSLGMNGTSVTISGSSVAAPFVTGALALVMALYPRLNSAELREILFAAYASRRRSVRPPLFSGETVLKIIQARQLR